MLRTLPLACLLLASFALIAGDAEVAAQKPTRPKPPDKAKPPAGKPKPPDKGKPGQTKPGQGDKGKFATQTIFGLGAFLGGGIYPQGSDMKVNASITFKDVKGATRPMTPGKNVELLAERVTGSQKYEVVAKAKTNARGAVTFEWKVGKNYPTGEHLVKARFPAQGKFTASESYTWRITIKRP